MKLTTAVVCLVLLMAGLSACGQDDQAPPTTPAGHTRWEYKLVGATPDHLRGAGLDGWEAFAVEPAEDGGTWMWLKRPVAPGAP